MHPYRTTRPHQGADTSEAFETTELSRTSEPTGAVPEPRTRIATAARGRHGFRGIVLRRGLLAIALATLTGLGVQASTATAAPTADQPQRPAGISDRGSHAAPASFYDPPEELPSPNGALVRSEELRLGLSLPGLNGPLPGKATRLMYKSTDSRDRPVAVTGAYIEPAAKWKGSGPRPLVALAPGTMGQGDQCAASKALEKPLSVDQGSLSVGYENLAVYRFLARGVAVVVTDYVGLGTTDRLHTYVNRLDGGHAVLDAVRAAHALPEASVGPGSPTGLYGYSEGGGATASAAELRSSYAPEVPLAGTYVGAPPADLVEVLRAVDGSTLAAALGWSINGFQQSEPAVREVVEKHINDKGREALEDTATMCVGDGIFGLAGSKSSSWTKNGKPLADIVAAEPVLRDYLDEQRIGRLTPDSPIRLATGTSDDLVDHEQARQLAVDWCAKDAAVTYAPVRIPSVGEKLLNHFAPLIADQGKAINWLTDRLAGEPAQPNCDALSR